MSTVFLSLGTNLGDRMQNLRAALRSLAPEIVVVSQSLVYETPPWGYEDQPAFLNLVIQCETNLAPLELLAHVKNLEKQLGRAPSFHWGPRLIDIDILLYDDLILKTPELTIPHPRLHERGFVLIPLADIAPYLIHPILIKTVAELLQNASTAGIHPYRSPA